MGPGDGIGLTAVLVPGNGVAGASDPGEDGMEEASGEEAGGEEAMEDGVDVLNMSTSVRCFVFIGIYLLVVVVACVVAVLTFCGCRSRPDLDPCTDAHIPRIGLPLTCARDTCPS